MSPDYWLDVHVCGQFVGAEGSLLLRTFGTEVMGANHANLESIKAWMMP